MNDWIDIMNEEIIEQINNMFITFEVMAKLSNNGAEVVQKNTTYNGNKLIFIAELYTNSPHEPRYTFTSGGIKYNMQDSISIEFDITSKIIRIKTKTKVSNDLDMREIQINKRLKLYERKSLQPKKVGKSNYFAYGTSCYFEHIFRISKLNINKVQEIFSSFMDFTTV